jgi:hypothetical protein
VVVGVVGALVVGSLVLGSLVLGSLVLGFAGSLGDRVRAGLGEGLAESRGVGAGALCSVPDGVGVGSGLVGDR